jgi:hypothetical protein
MELTGRDTLDTTTPSETADSGLGDTLDVVTQDLAVTLGTTLAKTLAALAACREDASVNMRKWKSATRGRRHAVVRDGDDHEVSHDNNQARGDGWSRLTSSHFV